MEGEPMPIKTPMVGGDGVMYTMMPGQPGEPIAMETPMPTDLILYVTTETPEDDTFDPTSTHHHS
jgi:hypothetical protein